MKGGEIPELKHSLLTEEKRKIIASHFYSISMCILLALEWQNILSLCRGPEGRAHARAYLHGSDSDPRTCSCDPDFHQASHLRNTHRFVI